MEPPSPRGPWPQDTLNAREKRVSCDQSYPAQIWGDAYPSDEEITDDSGPGERCYVDYPDDDDSSPSLSVPNESIDFDVVYSIHSFAATVEGQASVVRGDSLFLMDDSNSCWWLVCVLKTQDIGFIPADNVETPLKHLARLNKYRNIDVRPLCLLPLSNNSCDSWLRLPKQKCTMSLKSLAITFATSCLPALDPINSHYPLHLAMTHVS